MSQAEEKLYHRILNASADAMRSGDICASLYVDSEAPFIAQMAAVRSLMHMLTDAAVQIGRKQGWDHQKTQQFLLTRVHKQQVYPMTAPTMEAAAAVTEQLIREHESHQHGTDTETQP